MILLNFKWCDYWPTSGWAVESEDQHTKNFAISRKIHHSAVAVGIRVDPIGSHFMQGKCKDDNEHFAENSEGVNKIT